MKTVQKQHMMNRTLSYKVTTSTVKMIIKLPIRKRGKRDRSAGFYLCKLLTAHALSSLLNWGKHHTHTYTSVMFLHRRHSLGSIWSYNVDFLYATVSTTLLESSTSVKS